MTRQEIAKLCLAPPFKKDMGDTVFPVHQLHITEVLKAMQDLGYGGYAEITLIDGVPEAVHLTYDLRT